MIYRIFFGMILDGKSVQNDDELGLKPNFLGFIGDVVNPTKNDPG